MSYSIANHIEIAISVLNTTEEVRAELEARDTFSFVDGLSHDDIDDLLNKFVFLMKIMDCKNDSCCFRVLEHFDDLLLGTIKAIPMDAKELHQIM